MPLSYYIQNRVVDYLPENMDLEDSTKIKIKDLLDNIYNCCKRGNIGVSIQGNEYHYKKVHKKNVKHTIPTDITFTDLDEDLTLDFNYIENTKELKKDYIRRSFFKSQNIALIALDENNNIYTILTFFYNIDEECIEVDAFWSNHNNAPGGGSIMMNFLINAIKCAINLCNDPTIHKRKIILSSVLDDETINFYKNFDFVEIKEKNSQMFLVPFTRNLSTGSADLNENEIENENENDIENENENESIELLKEQHQKLTEQLKPYQYNLSNVKIIIEYFQTNNDNVLTKDAVEYMNKNNIRSKIDSVKLYKLYEQIDHNIDEIEKKIQTVLNKIDKKMENINLNSDLDKEGGKNKTKNKTKKNANKTKKRQKKVKKIKKNKRQSKKYV
jgi:hypothetical protein